MWCKLVSLHTHLFHVTGTVITGLGTMNTKLQSTYVYMGLNISEINYTNYTTQTNNIHINIQTREHTKKNAYRVWSPNRVKQAPIINQVTFFVEPKHPGESPSLSKCGLMRFGEIAPIHSGRKFLEVHFVVGEKF